LTDSARRPIPLVFVDTNVLYPVRLADLVLSCAVDGLFDLCVSDDLLDEIERVLTASKGLRTEKVRTFRSNVEAVATGRLEISSSDQTLTISGISPPRCRPRPT
jgi:hypothetical protein